MSKRAQITLGVLVIVWGLLVLIGRLAHFNIWAYLWPLILVALGAWLLLRPESLGGRGATQFQLLGDIRKRGRWAVRPQTFWCVIGDVRLDLTDADIPVGETVIKVQGFVGGVKVTVPRDVGLSISSSAAITSAHVFGFKQDYLFTEYDTTTEGYAEAERKVRLDIMYLVTELRVRRPAESRVSARESL